MQRVCSRSFVNVRYVTSVAHVTHVTPWRLQPLVREVDEQLLEPVGLKVLHPEDVEQANTHAAPRRRRAAALCGGGRRGGGERGVRQLDQLAKKPLVDGLC